jgi:hypothetical protein
MWNCRSNQKQPWFHSKFYAEERSLVNPKATTVRQWRWPASRPPCFILPLLSPHATNPQANASNRDRGKGDSTVDYQTNPPVCLSPHVCARPLTCIYISNSVSLQRRRKQRITFPYPHRVAFVAFLPPPGPNPLPWGEGRGEEVQCHLIQFTECRSKTTVYRVLYQQISSVHLKINGQKNDSDFAR